MLPVHCIPQTQSLYNDRIQPALYVPQPESADHAEWTGESAPAKSCSQNYLTVQSLTGILTGT